MKIYVRPAKTMDFEERLEDAALLKAVYDEFGDDCVLLQNDDPIPEDCLFVGRRKKNEPTPILKYWNDKGFLNNCSREFGVFDFSGAEDEYSRLQASGKGVFLKSVREKYWIGKGSLGVDFLDCLSDMAYSFMDSGPCLMVQELCEIKYEQRFLFINGQLAAESPIAWHLTPIDYGSMSHSMQFETPKSREPVKALGKNLAGFAIDVFAESELETVCIDCAWINDQPGVVEFNPLYLGNIGLYASDVRSIAKCLATPHGLGGV